jgi:hypothetical protein
MTTIDLLQPQWYTICTFLTEIRLQSMRHDAWDTERARVLAVIDGGISPRTSSMRVQFVGAGVPSTGNFGSYYPEGGSGNESGAIEGTYVGPLET